MDGELQFLNGAEARAVEAIAALVIPGDAEDPGAREAGVLTYIDRALAGAYRSAQPVYRRGLWELDRLCRQRHGAPFVELSPGLQDETLREIGEPPPTHPQFASDDSGPHASEVLYELFAHVRRHTIEGYFADPQYGGNRDAVGWRLVGFPGAQWGYSAEQMTLGFDAAAIPVKTLADLRRERGSAP
jgi:gluconate 2-dehydrogenase gamma chain